MVKMNVVEKVAVELNKMQYNVVVKIDVLGNMYIADALDNSMYFLKIKNMFFDKHCGKKMLYVDVYKDEDDKWCEFCGKSHNISKIYVATFIFCACEYCKKVLHAHKIIKKIRSINRKTNKNDIVVQ